MLQIPLHLRRHSQCPGLAAGRSKANSFVQSAQADALFGYKGAPPILVELSAHLRADWETAVDLLGKPNASQSASAALLDAETLDVTVLVDGEEPGAVIADTEKLATDGVELHTTGTDGINPTLVAVNAGAERSVRRSKTGLSIRISNAGRQNDDTESNKHHAHGKGKALSETGHGRLL